METLLQIFVPILLFGGFGTLVYFMVFAPKEEIPRKKFPKKPADPAPDTRVPKIPTKEEVIEEIRKDTSGDKIIKPSTETAKPTRKRKARRK